MRILLTHKPGGAFGFITESWMNALVDCNHIVERWDGNPASWNEFQPDLYIGCSGHKQPIPSNHKSKIAIHVNPYGPISVKGIDESQSNIDWVKSIKPDIVFGYGFDDDKIFWQYWTTKLGIKWCPMPTAGDKTIFKITNDLTNRKNDLVYVGGRWGYKSTSIDSFLLPAINYLNTLKYKSHVYGWGDWPNGICRGIIQDDMVIKVFNDAKIGPCISEPHTQKHGFDLPERFFKVSLCGLLPVHDPVPTLRNLFADLPMAKNPNEYKDLCNHYLCFEKERIELSNKIRDKVLNNHTYHHRLSRLFLELGLNTESKEML